MALHLRQEVMIMNISYRARQRWKRLGVIALILAAVLLLAAVVGMIWGQRYVVYDRDGARLDTSLDPHIPLGQVAVAPEQETVNVYFNEGENAISTGQELTQMVGFYADRTALEDMELMKQQAALLEMGTPVMLDVKDGKGRFFYSSSLSSDRYDGIDPAQMDDFIAQLDKKGMYLIARVPAFRDYAFGLSDTDNGLFVSSGGYLWADDDYCYWLDPTKQGTVTHLIDIVSELKKLGFDEVVFDNFTFPPTTDLKFSGDRAQALNTAAQTLVTTCADGRFAVSFIAGAEGFVCPEGRARLYMTDVAAAQAEAVAQASGLADRPIHWIVDDCAKFIQREIRRGRRYDGIIMDPPSYGRGPSGEIWKMETSFFPFLLETVKLLSDDPLFVIINSYTTGLAPSAVGYASDVAFSQAYGGKTAVGELGLPVTSSGLVLPCGSTGRWTP